MSHASRPVLDERHTTLPDNSAWRRLGPILLGAGLVLVVAMFVIGLTGDVPTTERFYYSYLTAFTYTLSIGLGALFFVLVQFVTRAGWSVGVRRIAENIMATLPLMIVLAIPMLIGVDTLYHHWTHAPADDVLVNAKKAYLNKPFFYIRAVVVLIIWTVLAVIFYRASTKQDRTGDKQVTRKLQMYAAPALMFFALSLTVAAIDWLMSLDPHWFSTMWGVYYFAGAMVAIFAVLSLLVIALRKSGNLDDHGVGLLGPAATVEHQHDLGKFLFAFTVFWSYVAFSQYMLIWYANMPEETVFFADRMYLVNETTHLREPTGWFTVTQILAVGHFILPFFFLMSRHIKRRNLTLVLGAVWLLVMHYVDLYWIVMPTQYPAGPDAGGVWLDLLTLVGCLLTMLGGFAILLGRNKVVPINDPRLPEALRFENF